MAPPSRSVKRRKTVQKPRIPRSAVVLLFTGSIIQTLLNIVEDDPTYLSLFFPAVHDHSVNRHNGQERSAAIFEINVKLFGETNRPWFSDMERRGLMKKDGEGNWMKAKGWAKYIYDDIFPTFDRIRRLSSQYRKALENGMLETWESWDEVRKADKALSKKIQKEAPYWFPVRKLIMLSRQRSTGGPGPSSRRATHRSNRRKRGAALDESESDSSSNSSSDAGSESSRGTKSGSDSDSDSDSASNSGSESGSDSSSDSTSHLDSYSYSHRKSNAAARHLEHSQSPTPPPATNPRVEVVIEFSPTPSPPPQRRQAEGKRKQIEDAAEVVEPDAEPEVVPQSKKQRILPSFKKIPRPLLLPSIPTDSRVQTSLPSPDPTPTFSGTSSSSSTSKQRLEQASKHTRNIPKRLTTRVSRQSPVPYVKLERTPSPPPEPAATPTPEPNVSPPPVPALSANMTPPPSALSGPELKRIDWNLRVHTTLLLDYIQTDPIAKDAIWDSESTNPDAWKRQRDLFVRIMEEEPGRAWLNTAKIWGWAGRHRPSPLGDIHWKGTRNWPRDVKHEFKARLDGMFAAWIDGEFDIQYPEPTTTPRSDDHPSWTSMMAKIFGPFPQSPCPARAKADLLIHDSSRASTPPLRTFRKSSTASIASFSSSSQADLVDIDAPIANNPPFSRSNKVSPPTSTSVTPPLHQSGNDRISACFAASWQYVQAGENVQTPLPTRADIEAQLSQVPGSKHSYRESAARKEFRRHNTIQSENGTAFRPFRSYGQTSSMSTMSEKQVRECAERRYQLFSQAASSQDYQEMIRLAIDPKFHKLDLSLKLRSQFERAQSAGEEDAVIEMARADIHIQGLIGLANLKMRAEPGNWDIRHRVTCAPELIPCPMLRKSIQELIWVIHSKEVGRLENQATDGIHHNHRFELHLFTPPGPSLQTQVRYGLRHLHVVGLIDYLQYVASVFV